jgi:diadenosine tetraphosphate (Ap4A) HIT family hydrolase
MSDDFSLDPRLAGDTRFVADLPLSRVLLMDDARFPWLLLVPRRTGLAEIADLDDAAQAQLWQEVNRVAASLRGVAPCDKLNIGALGNIVRQLHVHVVARRRGDAAWPGPVWGHGRAEPYAQAAVDAWVLRLQQHLASHRRSG